MTHYELLQLFKSIGDAYNQWIVESGLEESKEVFSTLYNNFGNILTERKVKKMGQFAKEYANFLQPNLDLPFFSWPHIERLLLLHNSQERHFYSQLILQEQLSAKDLKKQITAKRFEDWVKRGSLNNERKRIKKECFPTVLLENIYKRNTGFVGVRRLHDDQFFESEFKSYKAKTFYDKISNLIINYKTDQDRNLNAQFNIFLWEFGNELAQRLPDNLKLRHETVDQIVHQLSPSGRGLNKSVLQQALRFSSQVKDRYAAIRIAHLLSWAHIECLLKIPELETKLFYARLTAKMGMSVDELRDAIEKNKYNYTSEAKKREEEQLAIMQTPVQMETRSERRGQHTLVGTSVTIDFGKDIMESRAIGSIFENTTFMNFMRFL